MALTKISTEGFKDDAVTTDKIADSINSERTANTAKDLTALSASNLTSGTVPDARFPATLPAKSAANLTNIPAANITGALPAISGASLTNLPASGKATNIIVNGSMDVAQRGTSSTVANGYGSVDRFKSNNSGNDEAPTQSQVDVASGTTPYTLGFRKAFRMTNGNQTGGASADDRVCINYTVEGQDMAKSGWNYTDSNSYVTLSFWVKSSVAQNFYVALRARDGTEQGFALETGSLSANTWTKVTKAIPGNSNLTFDNDNTAGLLLEWNIFRGTSKTGSMTLDQWAAFNGSVRTPDQTSTWYTTNDATFEITGVLLEVGDTASDYPHESYAETLRKCHRYFYSAMNAGGAGEYMSWGIYLGNGKMMSTWYMPQPMRANATVSFPEGSNYYNIYRADGSDNFNSLGSILGPSKFAGNYFVNIEILSLVGSTGGYSGTISAANNAVYVHFSAEL